MNFKMIVLEKTINCVTFPFFVVSIILIFILIFSRKKDSFFLFIILIIPLLWRQAAKNQLTSSRYCSIFLILFVVYGVYALKSNCMIIKNRKTVWIITVLGLVASNLAFAFSSFRNTYIYDLQEEVSFLSNDKKNIFFVDNRDLKRLSTLNSKVLGRDVRPETNDEFEELLNTFEYWSKNAYYLFPERKNATPRIISTDIFNNNITLKKTAQFFTNKYKTKVYSTYCQKHFYPQSYDYLKKADNGLIQRILYNGILQSFNLEKDTYIYQINDKLYWIIGANIDKRTEIIYQVHSDQTDLLPETERKLGFENLFFFIGSKYELLQYGKYYVMERLIPSNYSITYINVGLNPSNEKAVFFRRFKPTDF